MNAQRTIFIHLKLFKLRFIFTSWYQIHTKNYPVQSMQLAPINLYWIMSEILIKLITLGTQK